MKDPKELAKLEGIGSEHWIASFDLFDHATRATWRVFDGFSNATLASWFEQWKTFAQAELPPHWWAEWDEERLLVYLTDSIEAWSEADTVRRSHLSKPESEDPQ